MSNTNPTSQTRLKVTIGKADESHCFGKLWNKLIRPFEALISVEMPTTNTQSGSACVSELANNLLVEQSGCLFVEGPLLDKQCFEYAEGEIDEDDEDAVHGNTTVTFTQAASLGIDYLSALNQVQITEGTYGGINVVESADEVTVTILEASTSGQICLTSVQLAFSEQTGNEQPTITDDDTAT